MTAPSPLGREAAAGINRIEGYLLHQAELGKAHAEAEAFARRMPWLTTAQHEEVVRLYAQERFALSKETLRTIGERCAELRGQYTARYEALRRRLLCLSVAALVGAAGLCAGAALLVGRYWVGWGG